LVLKQFQEKSTDYNVKRGRLMFIYITYVVYREVVQA